MSKYEDKLNKVLSCLTVEDKDKSILNAFYVEARSKMASNIIEDVANREDFSLDKFLGNSSVKVACLDDLFSFERVASDTLIHKSSEELWSIGVDASGQTFIAKLYDDKGAPLKV